MRKFHIAEFSADISQVFIMGVMSFVTTCQTPMDIDIMITYITYHSHYD